MPSGDGAKTIYYQVKNNAELISTFSDTILLDTLPPTGSIIINGGATYSNSTSVTLGLVASDATSGVSQVRFSNDGVWDSESWESFAATKSWTLTSGDEIKNVYYEIKDKAGGTSTFSSFIFLDMTLPVADAGQPQSAMVGQSVAFNGGGSTDNLDIASYSWDFGDGGTGSGVTPTHTYSSVGSFTVKLMVKDLAGNSAAGKATVTVEVVIPELPSAAVLVLFVMLASALAVVFRTKGKTPSSLFCGIMGLGQ